VLGEEIVKADALDARFAEKVDLRRQDRVLGASRWTNLMLKPPSEALGMLIGAMSQNKKLCDDSRRISTIRMCNGTGLRQINGPGPGSSECPRECARTDTAGSRPKRQVVKPDQLRGGDDLFGIAFVLSLQWTVPTSGRRLS
jgi:hypothetical protein